MPLENMTEREMLEELIAEKKRRDRMRPVWIAAAAVLVVLIAVFVVRFMVPIGGYVRSIEESMTYMQSEVEAVKEQAVTIMNDIQTKMEDIDIEGIKKMSEMLDQIDVDAASDVLQKLGNLVNKFPFLFR